MHLDLNQSTVGDEVAAGEVAGIVGSEKRHGCGDFLGLARTTERCPLDNLLSERVDVVLAQTDLASERSPVCS